MSANACEVRADRFDGSYDHCWHVIVATIAGNHHDEVCCFCGDVIHWKEPPPRSHGPHVPVADPVVKLMTESEADAATTRARARAMAMNERRAQAWVLHHGTGLSFAAIGRLMGVTSTTTAHYVRHVDRRIQWAASRRPQTITGWWRRLVAAGAVPSNGYYEPDVVMPPSPEVARLRAARQAGAAVAGVIDRNRIREKNSTTGRL